MLLLICLLLKKNKLSKIKKKTVYQCGIHKIKNTEIMGDYDIIL